MVTKDCGVSHGGRLEGNNIIFGESDVTAGLEIKKNTQMGRGQRVETIG